MNSSTKILVLRSLQTDVAPKMLDITLLVYRLLIASAMITVHGAKKVINFQDEILHIPDPLGIGGYVSTSIAIFSNVACTVFIALGLFTRPFALGALSVPIIGLLVVHVSDPWPVKDSPLMYSIAFLVIFILGPGRYSLDSLIHKKLLNNN